MKRLQKLLIWLQPLLKRSKILVIIKHFVWTISREYCRKYLWGLVISVCNSTQKFFFLLFYKHKTKFYTFNSGFLFSFLLQVYFLYFNHCTRSLIRHSILFTLFPHGLWKKDFHNLSTAWSQSFFSTELKILYTKIICCLNFINLHVEKACLNIIFIFLEFNFFIKYMHWF